MSRLQYHAAAFENLKIEPAIDPAACEILDQREAELGFQFPASVRELLQQQHADKLLMAVEDDVVPLKSFGMDYTAAYPIMRIFNDRDGQYAAFIHVTDKDDPDVRFAGDGNDWAEDDNGIPIKIIGSFSTVVREQTERVLEHEERMREWAKEQQEYWQNRSLWTRFWQSIKWLAPW